MNASPINPPFSTKAKAAFLDLTPPHWAARGLAYAIIAIALLGALASVAIRLPETIKAPFVLVPVHGADPIKATRGGTIAQVLASEGQLVNQGDLIVTLDSEAAGERTAELQTIQTQLAGAGTSAVNARLRNETQRLTDEQEARRLQNQLQHLDSLLANKRRQLALTKQMTESFETLYREGIASQAQLIAKQLEDSELTSEIERLLAEQQDTRATLEKTRLTAAARQTEFSESERLRQEQIATHGIRVSALQSTLVNTDGQQVRLLAPCTGTILRMRIHDKGAVVAAGETIAELACATDALQADLIVPETGIGKLKLEQGVKLKYDAFPYQRYGVKYGKLAWLSPAKANAEDNATTAFKARVTLADHEITSQGQPKKLAAGMSGTAEVVVGKRTLLSYAFEPIRQLRENLSDAP